MNENLLTTKCSQDRLFSLEPMSSEILWLYVLQPGGIHQTTTSDVCLARVDHFSENYNLEKYHSVIKTFQSTFYLNCAI